MILRGKLWAVGFAVLLSCSTARAAVDQEYDPGAGGGHFVSSASSFAQLFEAGMSRQVVGVDVRAYNYFGGAVAPLQLDLWSVGGSYPETLTTHLASASIDESLVPTTSGFLSFDLSSSGASFSAGQTYAIVLSTTSNFSYVWEGTSLGTYADGSGRQVSAGQVYYTLSGQDLDFGFRTIVSDVPEPAGVALVFIAALFFGAGRKARS